MVNSLHQQGVKQLGHGLVAEAIAPDGLIEAFRLADAPSFNLAVQWHPEWQYADNPLSMAIFNAFAAASQAHYQHKHFA
ncbi:gamma-glutamyl-gamma-aminobutyrate hydrolase family protein [Deefgea sp. CFH1-16]|uniref:gamma-glutamyl-gamma-aminobutyrate hydrolase family protein n=1 Tax=Deefgea sp. CFH1-16 TaxID=2675457 RepID=UPI0027DD82A0|nr:gamma-glutamyl-gamma-aminobutyrate hydrolase family protein [Deefgea sp. CFH1-16]